MAFIASVLIVSGCSTPGSTPAAATWEYKTVTIGKPSEGEYINRYATNGWEIVTFGIHPKLREEDASNWTLLLRRPKDR